MRTSFILVSVLAAALSARATDVWAQQENRLAVSAVQVSEPPVIDGISRTRPAYDRTVGID